MDENEKGPAPLMLTPDKNESLHLHTYNSTNIGWCQALSIKDKTRLLMIIERIINQPSETGYYLSSRYLRQVYTDYTKWIKIMKDNGFIEIVKQGDLNNGRTIIKLHGIDSLVNELDNNNFKSSKEYEIERDRILDKPRRSFLKYNLSKGIHFEDINWDLDVIKSPKETEDAFQSRKRRYWITVIRMNKGEFDGFNSRGGRIFSDFTSLPRSLRAKMKSRLGGITEIDINATVPRLTGPTVRSIIEKQINKDKTDIENYNKLLDKTDDLDKPSIIPPRTKTMNINGELSDDFDGLLKETEVWDSIVATKDDSYVSIGKYLGLNEDRDSMKKLLLEIIFGTKMDNKSTVEKSNLRRKLYNKFPLLIEWIEDDNWSYRMLYNQGLWALSQGKFISAVFKMESDILKATALTFRSKYPNEPILTLHDALYCLDNRTNELKNWFKSQFETKTKVTYRGKVNYISQPNLNDSIQESITNLKIGTTTISGKEYYQKMICGKRFFTLTTSSKLKLDEFIQSIKTAIEENNKVKLEKKKNLRNVKE